MKQPSIQPLDEYLPYQLYMIARLLRYYLTRKLSAGEEPLTPEQYFIIHRLYLKDAQTQKDLADNILHDYPNITRLLDKLEKNGLVKREDDENDRRNFIIKLTARGRKTFEQNIPRIKEWRKDLLQGIGMDEMKIAQEVVSKIKENMSA